MSNFNNNNSMFFNSRISSLIREYLVRNGISEDKIPADMSSKEFLINNLISKGIFNAPALVDGAINYAFDKKYFKYYSLEKDVHEYSDDWITDFHLILKKLNLSTKLNDLTMLNVGCNDGSQMKKLIGNNYKDIYLVDVGIRALQLAKEIFPNSIIINTNADILYGIPKNSIDLYLSFRTYNSSFFNIEGAISELNRVLCNNNAAVIISIPNGFVDINGNFISGLKPPKKDFINEHYPFEISGTIMFELSKYGFKNIGLLNSFYEIYIYSTRCISQMKNGPFWTSIIIEIWTTYLHNHLNNYIKIYQSVNTKIN